MSFKIDNPYHWPIIIPDSAFPGGGGFQLYTVSPTSPAPTFGIFATIQDAINQMITDGVDHTQPAVLFLEGGGYTEDFQLADGIHIMAAPGGGTRLINCGMTVAPNAIVSVSGVRLEMTGGATKAAFDFTGATRFSLYDIIGDGSASAQQMVVGAGDFVIRNCDLVNGTATTLSVAHSANNAHFIGNSQITNSGGGGNPALIVGADADLFVQSSYVESFVGGSILIESPGEGSTTCTVIDSYVAMLGGANKPGIDIQSGAALLVANTTFEVNTNGGTNSAINGVLGSFLTWGGLTFLPGFSNRVATTTIAGGASHMVVDSITAF